MDIWSFKLQDSKVQMDTGFSAPGNYSLNNMGFQVSGSHVKRLKNIFLCKSGELSNLYSKNKVQFAITCNLACSVDSC